MTKIYKKRDMQRFSGFLICVGILVPAMIFGGCDQSGPVIEASASRELPVNEESDEFLDRMSSEKNVSENDAFRGIIMLIDGQDESKTFEQRVTRLNENGILPSSWSYSADRPITRGKLAYIVYQADGFPGGAILTIFGPSRRYCLREMRYRGMMMGGAEYAPVSGMEYVAVLSRADVYRNTGKVPNRAGAID